MPITDPVQLDLVFVADPRFEGGASTALAAEIEAAHRAGFACGLLMVKGALLGLPFPVHPHITALVDAGKVAVLDSEAAVRARLVLLHHPIILQFQPTRRLSVACDRLIVVLHHPYRDQMEERQYDLDHLVAVCHAIFDAPVELAPVSVVVRDTLPVVLPKQASLFPENWDNVIDVDAWPRRQAIPPRYPVVIGRHARPDPAKWPETLDEALQCYPDDRSRFRVSILGGGTFLAELYDILPLNWEVKAFDHDGSPAFLSTLDFYVYFHGPVWLEAFGRTILEAMVAGVVVILPKTFEILFKDAAVYARPVDVKAVIEGFVSDPQAYAQQAERALAFARVHHGLQVFIDRVERLLGPVPPLAAPGQLPALPPATVLFVSTNGIGLGHLTQQLAIADRLPPSLTSVFATMSLAVKLSVDAGYETHFIPHHRRLGADADRWNTHLAEDLFELIAFVRPRVLAYDGTMPFHGLMAALKSYPDLYSIWVRRAMWREGHRVGLSQTHGFTAVIEPGELAADFDHGPTRHERGWVLTVPPVLHVDPAARLSRPEARARLGLGPAEVAVAMQLGSGNNFDMQPVRAAIIAALLDAKDVVIIEIESPIGEGSLVADRSGRYRVVREFPAFNLSNAFDFAVSAVGYNSFHENILGGLPTIFVPNEAPEMDLQLNRARYAELLGMGLLLRRDHDRYKVRDVVRAMLDPVVRSAIRDRCLALDRTNGADQIARFIADAARFVRADYDVTKQP
jgi:glycosyltransferase involved in cell wall biosynthesis